MLHQQSWDPLIHNNIRALVIHVNLHSNSCTLIFWHYYLVNGSNLVRKLAYSIADILSSLVCRILQIMGENKWMGKRWEDMDTDVLVKIFKELNLVELSPVSQVCRLWRLACSDPLIWSTLDFGLLKSNYIQTRASPYIWVDDRSDKRLSRILRVAMSISYGNVSCLIFHYNLYMKDEHLHYISER